LEYGRQAAPRGAAMCDAVGDDGAGGRGRDASPSIVAGASGRVEFARSIMRNGRGGLCTKVGVAPPGHRRRRS
jgi:hypothetical protein